MDSMDEPSASRLSNLVNEETYHSARQQMMDLVMSLKQDFQLEEMFNDVLFEHEIGLTPGALLVLVVPIVEAAYAQHLRETMNIYTPNLDTDLNTLRNSLEKIIEEAKNSPAPADSFPEELAGFDDQGKRWSFRSSISLIKAYTNRFCNIHPFCGDTE